LSSTQAYFFFRFAVFFFAVFLAAFLAFFFAIGMSYDSSSLFGVERLSAPQNVNNMRGLHFQLQA
jgi:hypothetical protein